MSAVLTRQETVRPRDPAKREQLFAHEFFIYSSYFLVSLALLEKVPPLAKELATFKGYTIRLGLKATYGSLVESYVQLNAAVKYVNCYIIKLLYQHTIILIMYLSNIII